MLELVADPVDAPGARAAEIAVPGERAAKAGGVLLVQEQLELLLAPVYIRRAQFPGQRRALRRELGLAARLLSLELAQLRFALETPLAGLLETPARGLHALLGVAELDAEAVALLDVGIDLLLDPVDA